MKSPEQFCAEIAQKSGGARTADHLPDLRKMVTTDISVVADLCEVLLAMPAANADLRPYAREQARLCGLTMNRWHRAALIEPGGV